MVCKVVGERTCLRVTRRACLRITTLNVQSLVADSKSGRDRFRTKCSFCLFRDAVVARTAQRGTAAPPQRPIPAARQSAKVRESVSSTVPVLSAAVRAPTVCCVAICEEATQPAFGAGTLSAEGSGRRSWRPACVLARWLTLVLAG